jgi:hypothetical protein
MASHEQQDLLTRLERLERENRRLKQAGVLAVLLCCSAFLMGQVKTRPVKPRTVRPVEAEQFVLKDIEGKKRAELLMEPGGPGLVLYDHEGNRIGRFGGIGEGNGAGLSLQGPGGSRVSLIFRQDGPHLLLFDTNGKFRTELGASAKGPYLFFNDPKEKGPRIALIIENEAPQLQLSDQEGFTAVLGSNSLVSTKTKEVHRTTAASLLLFGKEKEIIWRAP